MKKVFKKRAFIPSRCWRTSYERVMPGKRYGRLYP